MNLGVISLGWRGNLMLVIVGFPLLTFPGSMGGFCGPNMKSENFMGSEDFLGTAFMSMVGGCPQLSHWPGNGN